MILLLDTSTGECRVTIVQGDERSEYAWQADHDLARGLLEYIVRLLAESNAGFAEVTGLGVFRGPGSFTGLRIGAATLNTIADSEHIPLVGEMGDDWKTRALERLANGENDRVVLPDYGRAARITKPRK